MIEQGFYIISDEFFKQFPDPYLKGNKNEKRPHCYAILDQKTGLYWMIPMSSRVDKYRSIMENLVIFYILLNWTTLRKAFF